jgi:LPXTG-motif cell wall-anchored protein
VGGANALNNAQLNVPVTVCGLAVLGDANCASTVGASNAGGTGTGSSAGAGSSSANGNSGLLGGLNLLNNLQANIPVTVCGLAVLGDASATCAVEATNTTGTGTDTGGSVEGASKDKNGAVRGATLPHTGAAGMALIPFGLALVAGGVALRRRVGA